MEIVAEHPVSGGSLSLAGFIERMQWLRVEIQSEAGQGTCVTVRRPIVNP